MGALGVTPYIDRALEVLELAERGNDPEHRALVIARDGTVAGLALFGTIAGTADGAKLHTAVLAPGVEAERVGARLMRAVVDARASVGATFLLAEMPDDPAIGTVLTLLRAAGLHGGSARAGFLSRGVALTFLRLAL